MTSEWTCTCRSGGDLSTSCRLRNKNAFPEVQRKAAATGDLVCRPVTEEVSVDARHQAAERAAGQQRSSTPNCLLF